MMSFANKQTRTQPAEPFKPPELHCAHGWRLLVRNSLAIAVFVLGFSPLSLTGSENADEQLPFASASSKDLPRFHAIHSYFYRGAAPSYAGMDQLKAMGFKTVIDLRKTPIMIDAERNYLAKLGVQYINIPMGNWVPSLEKQSLFMRVLNDAASHPDHAPVFLHCSHGSDRTGFLTALWRVEHDHWSIAKALAEMFQHGFFIHKFENSAEQLDQ